MITGSLAASHHGRPRATHDADLVIDLESEQLDALLRDLEIANFYADAAGAHDALMSRRQFNVMSRGGRMILECPTCGRLSLGPEDARIHPEPVTSM